MSTRAGVGSTYMEYSWDNGLRNNDIILVSLKKYDPANMTFTPSAIPTQTSTPTVTTTATPTALPTTGMFTNNYHYDASQPHAVTGVDREFRQDKFTYDANGNQTTRLVDGVTYTLAYDEENRIETVTDTQASQTWTFHYDGNGTRVRQVNPDGSQLLLLNGGRYHVEIAADTTVSTTRYYSIAGQRPAMRNNDGSINYLLGDHLGSVSTVVNASGQIISQSRYLPFGELLWEDGTSPTDYTYTGQRSLSDIGLMDYNARFYDPMLGRFTSSDSIIPEPGSIIGYNLYAYVNNNPMIYVDPTGNRIADDPGYVSPSPEVVVETFSSLFEHSKTNRASSIYNLGTSLGVEVSYLDKDPIDAIYNLFTSSASMYDKNDSKEVDNFMKDMTCAINGFCDKNTSLLPWFGATGAYNTSDAYPSLGINIFPGRGSWKSEYYDYSNSQLAHFWFYVATTYFNGGDTANIGNNIHDPAKDINLDISLFGQTIHSPLTKPGRISVTEGNPNDGSSIQDYDLGKQGVYLGTLLRYNQIGIDEVGMWIKNNLGEN
jgi:RHS repeat-associated protein